MARTKQTNPLTPHQLERHASLVRTHLVRHETDPDRAPTQEADAAEVARDVPAVAALRATVVAARARGCASLEFVACCACEEAVAAARPEWSTMRVRLAVHAAAYL